MQRRSQVLCEGRSILQIAISRRMSRLAEALIRKGCDYRALDPTGMHAFALAVRQQQEQLVK